MCCVHCHPLCRSTAALMFAWCLPHVDFSQKPVNAAFIKRGIDVFNFFRLCDFCFTAHWLARTRALRSPARPCTSRTRARVLAPGFLSMTSSRLFKVLLSSLIINCVLTCTSTNWHDCVWVFATRQVLLKQVSVQAVKRSIHLLIP